MPTGGDEGPLARALATGGNEAGRELLEQLIRIYGHENVYVELQRHYNRAEEKRNHAAIELARSLRLPLLATQGARICEAGRAADTRCLYLHSQSSNAGHGGRLLAGNSERYIKTAGRDGAAVCRSSGSHRQHAGDSSRLDFTLSDLGYEFPRYPVARGETMDTFLRKRASRERAIGTCGKGMAETCGSARGSRSSASWR